MKRLPLLLICMFYFNLAQASPSQQVDIILFAHQGNTIKNSELTPNIPFLPTYTEGITLKSEPDSSYQLLKSSFSSLHNEYYRLNHNASYQILAHYSWKQPKNNQRAVALPLINNKGWQIQGTVRARLTNYFLFDAQLHCSPPSNPESSFSVVQKQRLKGGMIYYFDNPHVGMIVKIHT